MSTALIDKLTVEILHEPYFYGLLDKCAQANASANFNFDGKLDDHVEMLSNKELKDSLRYADLLSNSDDVEARRYAYQIITHLNSTFSSNVFYRTVAKAVYSKLGNFPAINYLEEKNENLAEIPFYRILQMESKKILQAVPYQKDLVFTDAQYQLYSKLVSSTEFSFSGPTSMGKSFIIKAFIKKIIRNAPRENMVIIVPTRALINQFALDLKNDLNADLKTFKYKIITNSSVNELTEESFNYIMVLTPERLISFLGNDHQTSVGFLFVDEAHKLAQQKDTRSITTYAAIEKSLIKYGQNLKLYFSSPNVSNPEVFLNLFDRNSIGNIFKTSESPVTQNIYFVDLIEKRLETIQKSVVQNRLLPFDERLETVVDVITYLGRGQNNLIYNNSKQKTINLAKTFADSRPANNDLHPEVQKAIVQIKEYVHSDYYLADLLTKGVAYHHGRLPQLIRNLVEYLYKNELVTYVFCTSTLLEGVNMPTKNLFVLNNKNGRNKLEEIDFWNLVGRAGRLNVELSGNIYCIRHDDCNWDNKDSILQKKEIKITPTVISRIDANLKKIEKILQEESISGTQVEKDVLKYIANIISIDSLQTKSTYQSPIINKLIADKKEAIIDLAKKKGQNITVPFNVLNSNPSININIQQLVYDRLVKDHKNGISILLPNSNSEGFYETCKSLLEKFHVLYNWPDAEKKLNNINSMSYYATLMTQWIKGFNLNQIIQQSIDYYTNAKANVEVDFSTYVPFEEGNVKHMNIVIENVIDDIEYVLRFLLEKYFNHYYQMLLSILGEDKAGENWANLLEYGTQNRTVIALQNVGLSRHTALSIFARGRIYLNVEEGRLKGVNKEGLISLFKHNSIEYDEINKML
ncbi:DEAD/DEAH box helicase [Pedobacter steynii]|uniref:DEAD/DEAH box helicase n=1 Tax=Pedobacter steynii TaxID=430522 RepID=A0A1G9KAJ0_9SPHI|nr:DEAD/DEAH box helicase [Pedobacter steynii]NQX38495.1 DEAD/DEAH box helicase [Pedobacter steynii]SDL46652.1 DEAD/DEAH box helicase [Pedobacter steynii]